jgi:putative ABC transport system substrate-binding protein
MEMRRRDLIALSGLLPFALRTTARAQPAERMRRIGFLLSAAEGPEDPLAPLEIHAFVEALRGLGWVEGRNIAILRRASEGRRERLRENARELVGLGPDVIVTVGGIAAGDLLAETRTIPIVFTVAADPVGSGFVPNLAHPGGNATGFVAQEAAIAGKWLELLKEIAPRLNRALVIMQAESAPQRVMRGAVAAAASSLGVAVVSAEARDMTDYGREIAAFAREPDGGLVVLSNGIVIRHPEEVHALAARYRLPAVYSYPIYAKTGGLISYGSDPVGQFPEAARYVDRILRGEKPGDLPVQQPTRFTLVVNLKTAKALGLAVPQSILARADEVIE